jgi:hypothetical protein
MQPNWEEGSLHEQDKYAACQLGHLRSVLSELTIYMRHPALHPDWDQRERQPQLSV